MKAALFVLYAITIVICSARRDHCPKICELEDVTCTTKGAANQYKAVVAGVVDLVPPLDPLIIKSLECKNATTTPYVLTNIELKGLKKCAITKLLLNVTTNVQKSYLHCPELTATFNYAVGGKLPSSEKIVVKVCDYEILIDGTYGVFVSSADYQPHFFLKTILPRVKAKVVCDVQRIPDSKDQNTVTIETGCYLMAQIVKKAMRILCDSLNVVLRRVLMSDILPALVSTTCKKH